MGFDWPSSPSSEAMIRALELLYSLGVLDDDAKLTSPAGFQVAEIPLVRSRYIFSNNQNLCFFFTIIQWCDYFWWAGKNFWLVFLLVFVEFHSYLSCFIYFSCSMRAKYADVWHAALVSYCSFLWYSFFSIFIFKGFCFLTYLCRTLHDYVFVTLLSLKVLQVPYC